MLNNTNTDNNNIITTTDPTTTNTTISLLWNNLPTELLPYILQYLPSHSILHSICYINKSWYNATKHTLTWKYNIITIYSNTIDDQTLLYKLQQYVHNTLYGIHIKRMLSIQLVSTLCTYYSNIKYLHITTSYAYGSNEWTITDDDCFMIGQYCKQLTYIDIDSCWLLTDAGISYICQCKHIDTLILHSTSQLTDMSLMYIGKLTQLNELEILLTAVGLDNSLFTEDGFRHITSCSELQHIALHNCLCNNNMLLNICELAKLHTLTLVGCDQMNSDAYVNISNLKLLTELTLEKSRINDDTLYYISQCESIKKIKIVYNSKITDNGIKHLLNLKDNLTHLNISHNILLTDISMLYVSELINLTTLDITSCSLLTDISLQYLTKLTQLTLLHMLACNKITNQAVDIFMTNMPQLIKLRRLGHYTPNRLSLNKLKINDNDNSSNNNVTA